ncbi:ABC transporter ATP-binding protein [Larkinella punicea]|uniref:ABC transporter ATP-binding protein n=1 Tax=Larkinella punicea TaxID=2315727 RepID=A0A368JIZ7_9BACT|nr:ABC transporter ATP-binding protein [Larkinella punicea]
MKPIIKVKNLSKQYRLGAIGTGTMKEDAQRWWYRIRGKEDPYQKIGESSDHRTNGNTDYVWAIKEINFEVMPGDILGIIGKNGAGKSTLLKILSKVTGPTIGSISYNGRIGSLLEVGTGFHPELTGRENIFLNGAILGMTNYEIRSNLDEIIDFSGCEKYIDTPVKRYSSGMAVRLGFAVAAHLDPEILVVDEVLAVGDAEFQKKAIGKMQDVSHNKGRTILFVSHNMASIQHLCKTGIVLENGRIVNQDEISKCINSYLGHNIKTTSRVIDSISYCHPKIKIDSILINEQESNSIRMGININKVKIVINGFLKEEKAISLELRIYDNNEIPLAFFSPGHKVGKIPVIQQGSFSLLYEMELPNNMNKGSYICDMYLTYPGQATWLTIPRAIYIEADGKSTETGMVFEYEKGAGFLFL